MAGHRGWLVGPRGGNSCLEFTPGPGGASSLALLLQHPRVPVLGQHPEQEEQHEDAARRGRDVHPVSGEGMGILSSGVFWASAAGCQRWFVPTGTWITRFLCHWPTGSSLCTSGKQVRLDLGRQRCSPKSGGCWRVAWAAPGEAAQGGIPGGMLETPHSEAGGDGHSSCHWNPVVAPVALRGDLEKVRLQPPHPVVH